MISVGPMKPTLDPPVEAAIHAHLKRMEAALFGLTKIDVRRLAYAVAEKLGVQHPFSHANTMAGYDWLRGFLSRHDDLSVRIPQGTNIARAVGFNRVKVGQFCNALLKKETFTGSSIWNMDETRIINMHTPRKVIATKGVRQVGKMTSGERGATVTVICAMSASGQFLPPMMIFPRKCMLDQLMRGAPAQSVGVCSTNGWTDCDLFVKWLKHFVKMTNASRATPQLIIIDGHNSHKSLEAITFAVEHGIHLITLPPHCTHKMQPLDRTYFKSLKADSWMVSNPGNRITASLAFTWQSCLERPLPDVLPRTRRCPVFACVGCGLSMQRCSATQC